jgi:hypothetical protein
MTHTALDTAHIAMEASPDDDTARLAFYERLADSELFILLEKEAEGDQIEPRLFETKDVRLVLVFDREYRLTEFAEGPAPYAALSGRSLTDMLNGQDIGLGVNLGVAPSSIIIPAAAVSWLHQTLGDSPEEVAETPEEIGAPVGLPERLITGLDTKLAQAAGLARFAYLTTVTYKSGQRSHMLAFIDTLAGAEATLAGAAREALVFSGLDAGEIDVAFFTASDPMAAKLAKAGLRFDLPEAVQARAPGAPGMDPNTPPRLK